MKQITILMIFVMSLTVFSCKTVEVKEETKAKEIYVPVPKKLTKDEQIKLVKVIKLYKLQSNYIRQQQSIIFSQSNIINIYERENKNNKKKVAIFTAIGSGVSFILGLLVNR